MVALLAALLQLEHAAHEILAYDRTHRAEKDRQTEAGERDHSVLAGFERRANQMRHRAARQSAKAEGEHLTFVQRERVVPRIPWERSLDVFQQKVASLLDGTVHLHRFVLAGSQLEQCVHFGDDALGHLRVRLAG